jgi:hypothetical protein
MTYIVAVYMADKAFGGHEEGGWWYDTGRLMEYRGSLTAEQAEIVADEYREQYPRTGKRSSVLGGDDWDVLVLDVDDEFDQRYFLTDRTSPMIEPAPYLPKQQPHYE